MIIAIAVLLVLLFLACVAITVLVQGVKAERQAYANLQLARSHDANAYEKKIEQVQAQAKDHKDKWRKVQLELEQLAVPKEATKQDDKPLTETGVAFKMRTYKKAKPDTYQAVFELNPTGQRVLQDLVARFSRAAFASDANGGERETCRRLGQAEVINHINLQIYKANNPDQFEQVDNDD